MYELDDSVGDYAIDLPPVIENKEEDVIVLQELEDATFEEGVEVLEQLLNDHDKLANNIEKMHQMQINGVDGSTRQVVAESANFRKYLEKRYFGKTGYSFASEAFYYGGDTRKVLATESEESSNIFVRIWKAIKKAFDWFIDKISTMLFGDPAKQANELRAKHDADLKNIQESMKRIAQADNALNAQLKEKTKGLDKALSESVERLESLDRAKALLFKKGIEDSKALQCLNEVLGSYYIAHDVLKMIGEVQNLIDTNIRNKSVDADLVTELISAIRSVHDKLPAHGVKLDGYTTSVALKNLADAGAVNAISDFSCGGMFCMGLNSETGRFHAEFIELSTEDAEKAGLAPMVVNPSSIAEVNWLGRKKEYDRLEKANREFRAYVDKIKNHYSKDMDAFVEQSTQEFEEELAASGKTGHQRLQETGKKIIMSMEKDIMSCLSALGRVSASVNRTFTAFEKELGKSIKEVEKVVKEVEKEASKEDNA